MSDEYTSEEWWSVDARPEDQGLGRQEPRPIDENCSFGLVSLWFKEANRFGLAICSHSKRHM